ncbi:hypothetical protein CHS0354_035793 [Potamilus streckersoni]|uniref:NAD(+) kinase n=1 Tax=Potamilus streckersoni TaxID=2493646 RepID=A0AAE0SWT5_9BIVA|nr:hypothetical protein CHS0354_035793 [Potamilus streckersoni]
MSHRNRSISEKYCADLESRLDTLKSTGGSDSSINGLRNHCNHLNLQQAGESDDTFSSHENHTINNISNTRNRRARSLYGVSPNCKFGPKGSLQNLDGTVLTIPDPASQKLKWHKPPLSVLVVKKIQDDAVLGPFKELVIWLIEVRKMIVFLEASVLQDGQLAMTRDSNFERFREKLQTFKEGIDDLTGKIDFIICLGGDGTLLHASSLFQQSCPPVMAFHMGSLGFLTPFKIENFQEQITDVLEGNATLLLRCRLKCDIKTKDTALDMKVHVKNTDRNCSERETQLLVLNEVVVDRGSSSFLCNVDLYIDGMLVTTIQGDGIIISTPTGSTAYAVAAGASMVHPSVPAIMITPICPHSLSFRPIVVPAGVEIKIMLSPEARSSAMVSFDGRNRKEINLGDSVQITTAQYPLPALCAKNQIVDWFNRLAECLHWNVRKQQHHLDTTASASSVKSLDSTEHNHVNS